MSGAPSVAEQGLDASLQTLVATHGYEAVSKHLVRLAQSHTADAQSLVMLPPEQREQSLAAAAALALPAYEADLKRPPSERQLVPDLEGGDFHEYE